MSNSEIITEETGKVFILRFPMCIDNAIKTRFEADQAKWLNSQATVFVFDLTRALSFSKNAYSVFVQFSQVLKKSNRQIFSFGMNEKLVRQLTLDGIFQTFNNHKSLSEILVKSGVTKKSTVTLDSNFINPFITSTINVLNIQAKVDVTAGKPYTAKTQVNKLEVGIAAVITMISAGFNGVISIEFPGPVFLKIYESMLGEKFEELNDEIKDGASEVLNMIFGQAKSELNQKGYQLDKALPTVLMGEKLKVHHDSTSTALIIPLHSTAGDFNLQVSINT